jgi:hypothetical protein
MIIEFTEEFARMLATNPPTTVGEWIEPRYRISHVYERVMRAFPMTVRSIALAIGMDVAPLDEAWLRYREGAMSPTDVGISDVESNRLAAETVQESLVAALRLLEDGVRPMIGDWGFVPGVTMETIPVPGVQRMAEQAILKALQDRSDGVIDIIAAWMVVSAATPEEIDEAIHRFSVTRWNKPERIRQLRRTVDEIVELWYMPPSETAVPRRRSARTRASLQDVGLLSVRLALPVIPDPDDPEQHPISAAIIRRRGDGYGYVTVVGGPRDGEQLGSFRCTGDGYPMATHAVMRQLSITGTIPPIDAGD